MTQGRPTVVVLGSMCRLPVPGVVFQLLHYLVGLERLGYRAVYVEWHGNWVCDPEGGDDPAHRRVPVGDVLRAFGFGDRWTCRAPQLGPDAAFGPLGKHDLPDLYADAEAILNVTGAHVLDDEMRACPTRIYVESDPGIPQIELARGSPHITALLAGHTHHATFGELVGSPDCRLPDVAVDYLPTRQPIALDLWDDVAAVGDAVTSIARWVKPKDKSIELDGVVYHWDKKVSFQPYLDLPRHVARPFRLALAELGEDDRDELHGHGWTTIDAMVDCVDLDDYRRLVGGSWAEFTTAKEQYVGLRTGWFSDRSACYLAAGRPVVTQDTGFSQVLPTGEGLFAFAGVDEAVEALGEIARDPERHRAAARRIAEEHFDAAVVLRSLLERCGVTLPTDPRP